MLRPGTASDLGLQSVRLWPGRRGALAVQCACTSLPCPVGSWRAAAHICCSVCSPYLVEIAAAAERKPVPTGRGEPSEYICLIMQSIYSGCELLPRIGF